MSITKKLFINVFVYLLMGTTLMAQATDNSPYSRLGLGDISSPNLVGVGLQGGLGSSYLSNVELNIANPASYGFLDYTVFDVGVYAKYARLKDANHSDDIWSGNLRSISLGFPLRNINNEIFDRVDKDYKWGMNFTLKPYSTVNYDILTTSDLEGVGEVVRNYTGNGGTYTLKVGTGFRKKNWGLGFNVGYLFGNISNEQYITIPSTTQYLNEVILNNYNVNGFVYDIGGMYRLTLNQEEVSKNKSVRKKSLVFGVRGNLATSFKTSQLASYIASNQILGLSDTLYFDFEENIGNGKLPAVVGFGATYYNGRKSSVGVEIENSFWSQYQNDARPEQSLKNSYRLSAGGQYLPDEKGFGNILERTKYKWGLYYETDPRQFDNNSLTKYGVTLGMGLPLFYQKAFSQLNLGFDLGRKGMGTSVEETFVQFNLGINFNDDQWFLQTRYN